MKRSRSARAYGESHQLSDGRSRAGTVDLPSVQSRLREVLGRTSFAEIARRTGLHAESVRRYCGDPDGKPSLQFVMAVCEAWNVNANWLLFGIAPRHGRELHAQIASSVRPEQVGAVYACIAVRLDGAPPPALTLTPAAKGPPHMPPIIVLDAAGLPHDFAPPDAG